MSEISVIIPIYNKALYLEKCIDSLLDQTFKDIEIICVDDGSTDSSWDILRKLSRYPSIKLIRNAVNQGGAESRNIGMRNATGKYIIFLDADDWFDKRMLEKLYLLAVDKKADIVFFDYIQIDEITKEERVIRNPKWVYNMVKTNKGLLPEEGFRFFCIGTSPATWNKFYSRSFLTKIGAEFQNISSSNDVFFGNYSLLMADRVTLLDEKEDPLLFYRTNIQDQIINNIDKDPLSVYKALEKTLSFTREEQKIQERKISFRDRVPINLLHAFARLRTEKGRRIFLDYAINEGGLKKLMLDKCTREDFITGVGYTSYLKLMKELGVSGHMIDDVDFFPKYLFDDLKRKGWRCALWGYGKNGKMFLDAAKKNDFSLQAIIDNDPEKQGLIINNITINNCERTSFENLDAVIFLIKSDIIEDIMNNLNSRYKDMKGIDMSLWKKWQIPLKFFISGGSKNF